MEQENKDDYLKNLEVAKKISQISLIYLTFKIMTQ